MGALFGTDGVRGLANKDITAELAVELAVAAAHVLGQTGEFEGHVPRALIARDTRASGEFLASATAAGLASAGVLAVDVGVLPTPGLAYLTSTRNVDLGVMISASHNPMEDNGIKFFDRNGYKLPDEIENKIEARLGEVWDRPLGPKVGRIQSDNEMWEIYVAHLVSTVPCLLDGLRVVVDCANGASSKVAPIALRQAGADVMEIHTQPDGLNINDQCGSTHPESLQKAVIETGADAGIAYDGDADRCLAVDATGELVDGDQIMGILGLSMFESDRLAHNTLVATVMSNLGLLTALKERGITVVTTSVGDRYVLEEMLRSGHSLGGEQSGHVIMSEFATTGDGVLTSLQLLARVASSGQSLRDLASIFPRYPQILLNVPNVDKSRVASDEKVQEAVAKAAEELGETGRVLLRPSGTEPLVRIMVEAQEQSQADSIAASIEKVVIERLSL